MTATAAATARNAPTTISKVSSFTLLPSSQALAHGPLRPLPLDSPGLFFKVFGRLVCMFRTM